MAESPHLLHATLSLSAAGLISRGIYYLGGIDISQTMIRLQSSGISSLRLTLANGRPDARLLATCLIWSLVEVFSAGKSVLQSSISWRIHLEGFKALLGSKQAQNQRMAERGALPTAMRHIYLLYLSLETLPYIPQQAALHSSIRLSADDTRDIISDGAKINGFLGYRQDVLHILQQVNDTGRIITLHESDILLGRVHGMILRDSMRHPDVAISSTLSSKSILEFVSCNKIFQLATLITIYRRLYKLSSNSKPIRDAFYSIKDTVDYMTQGKPCHAWVAMSMPLFTVGCEAFESDQQDWVRSSIDQLYACIGSSHVFALKQALEDIWLLRKSQEGTQGFGCSEDLLRMCHHSILTRRSLC